MNGNMNLGRRISVLENGGGSEIKKEIAVLSDAVATAQNEIAELDSKVNSGKVHSTEEKVVGKWIDGKPIYEISYYTTGIPASSSETSILGTISNVDKMITISGSWKWQGDIDVQPIGNRGGNKAWCDVLLQNDVVKAVSSVGCEYLTAILQYTKNNDNPTE